MNGAGDPLSGASAELEEARGLGELLKQGWHPQRTIIYCFWDGEEPALLGSTEWVEAHAPELSAHAVAYFNSDGNSRGYFRAEGSSALENFVNSVTKDIEDPETKMPVWKRQRLVAISRATARWTRANFAAVRTSAWRLSVRAPTTRHFIHHLGIASVNLGYGGEDQGGGQYHSVYDDFYWYTHFQDTDFVYGRALAQTAGTMMMRMADADVIPFQFGDLADTVRTYVTGVKKLTDTMRAEIKERNTEIADGVYKALEDPKKKRVAPEVEALPPYLNFAPLDQAMDDLTTAATEYDKAFTANALKAPRRI